MINNQAAYICRICGLLQDEEIWGEDGKILSFNICNCCGSEFGYEDFQLFAVKLNRERWMQKGCPWNNPKFKPETWSIEEQLAQIPWAYQ
jgi:hypothetical protein